MVATRLACARTLCISRYCRSRRVLSKAMVACAAKSERGLRGTRATESWIEERDRELT